MQCRRESSGRNNMCSIGRMHWRRYDVRSNVFEATNLQHFNIAFTACLFPKYRQGPFHFRYFPLLHTLFHCARRSSPTILLIALARLLIVVFPIVDGSVAVARLPRRPVSADTEEVIGDQTATCSRCRISISACKTCVPAPPEILRSVLPWWSSVGWPPCSAATGAGADRVAAAKRAATARMVAVNFMVGSCWW